MKESIDKIRKALSRQDIVSLLTHYRFNDWTVSAADGRMTACAPIDFNISCAVPGKELERLVDKLPLIEKIEVRDSNIIVKSGRARSTIKTMPLTDYTLTQPGPYWRPVPTGFLDALKTARPFVSDNAVHSFALSVCLGSDSIYATNNISVVKIDCLDLDGRGELLPCWAIDYLLSRSDAELIEMQVYPDYAAFRYEDDSWIRTSLISGEFPSVVPTLYEKYQKPTWEITDDWKESFGIISELIEEYIDIYSNKLVGRRGASEVEYKIFETPIPQGSEFSRWSLRYLKPVIDLATHWQPDKFPLASEFWAPNVSGFIVGRRN